MKRKYQSRLARKIVLAFALVLLIPASVIALYTYQQAAEQLLAQSRLEGLRIAGERATRVEALIQEMTADVLFLSQLPPVHSYVHHRNYQNQPDSSQFDELPAIEQIYAAFLRRSVERYQRVCLLHENGMEIACAESRNSTVRIVPETELRNRSRDLAYQGALTLHNQDVHRPIYIANTSFAEAGSGVPPRLYFSLALQGEKVLPSGVVVLEASTKPLIHILAGDLEHWQVHLIDRDGSYPLPFQKTAQSGTAPGESADYLLQTVSAPLSADTASDAVFAPADHPDQTLAYARIIPGSQDILDWTVVYSRTHAAILSDVYSVGQVTLLITLVSLLAALLMALFLTRSIISPISKLALAAEQIGAGRLDMHIPVRTNDEVGALAHAFNQMTDRLQETLQHLQQRVAELEEARHSQRNSEAMLRHVVDSIRDHIYTTEFDTSGSGRNLYLSPNFADLTGYDVERIRNDWYCWGKELIHRDDHPTALQHLRRLKSGRNSEVEYRIVRTDGEIVWVRDNARVKPEAQRTIIYGVISDITARRRLEEQLLQAQKMEAVGRLAGGIAHDFNNILTYIIASCDLLMLDLGADDPVAQEIAQIQEAGQRAVGLTSQLLAFSRRQIMQPRLLDLNQVVTGVEKLLRRLIGEDIDLNTYPARSLPLVHVDPVQLEQVIVNLAVNARDAMPAGGRLTIATSTREFGADAQVGDEEIVPGTYVLLAISDTGTGISEQVLPHIFEPFFTTKSSSQGSGLGLATVHGIVRQSGGHIRVHSREQVGTSFEIYLPVAVAGEQHQEIVQPPVHDMRGNETVLLVEDDEQVRSLVSRVLDRYGYRVIEAHNGVQAQEIADTLGEAIQVLVTDIVMDGGINGIQLAQILAHRHHHLSIICMSGYTDYSLGALHQIDAPVVFLQKPFAPQTLVRNLRGLLESSPPAI